MKTGNALINLVIGLIAAALLCYLGYHAYNTLTDPFTTTYAYDYVDDETVQADGYLVRAERVLTAQPGIVNVTRAEGEKVAVGQQVALVHRNNQAVAMQAQLDDLEAELAVLDYALEGAGALTSARLDESILQSLVELRSSAAVSDYSDLEEQVLGVKSQVLKRAYTYDQGLDLSDLTQRRQAISQQYQSLSSSTAGTTSRVNAPVAGIFSAVVDGYEDLLTPESVLTLTPSQLDKLDKQAAPVDSGMPGKLITSTRWYLVLTLSARNAGLLTQGENATIGFSGDFDGRISMRVDQIGPEENGRCTVVLSTDRYLNQTLLLREQSVEIVLESRSGLRVPKTALRMVSRTSTDSETGEEVTRDVLGVYTIVAGQAEFKAVSIVSEGADFYVVAPAGQGGRSLRSGDQVVVRALDLYDGKQLID